MRKIFFLTHTLLFLLATSVCASDTTAKINHNREIAPENKYHEDLPLPLNIDFNFNNDGTCSGTPVTFTPAVTGDAPFAYQWDFGDGNTSNSTNPTHTFTALGCGFQNFNVKLTVTDANNVSKSVTKVISVQQKPDLKLGYLIHWEFMKKSIEMGYNGYNISMGGSKGVVEFKSKFNTTTINFIEPHYHLILKPFIFNIYTILNSIFVKNKKTISVLLKRFK